MNHPARNALGSDILEWLEQELVKAGAQPILLTGSGEAFCAGLNLKEVVAKRPEEMPAFLEQVDSVAARLFDHPAPTVAAINGHAIAGGCVLALCCDYRVLGDNPKTRVGVNEVALGACYPPRIFRIVQHRLPAQHVHRICLGAELHGSREALELGLVDEIANDVEGRAREWLEALAAHPRETYCLTKAELNHGVTHVTPEELAQFAERQVPLWSSDEMRQRMNAILGH